MRHAALLIIGALAFAAPAAAQDAAETAVILSGSGAAQSRAGGAMGSAISGAMNRAAGNISGTASPRQSHRKKARGSAAVGGEVPAGVDPLEGSDAETLTTDTGATVSVSGGFRPSARAREPQATTH